MFIKKDNIIKRKIHGTYFLIDITQNYLNDKCSLYEINEIGSFIWDHLNQPITLHNIVTILINNISGMVDNDEVYSDVKEFIEILVEEHFVEVVDGEI